MNCSERTSCEIIKERPLWGGLIVHDLILLLCAVFMSVATSVSCWLILDHALHYLRPAEQKHILRILGMTPVYAIISFLSILFYKKYIYLELLRNCYEAFVVASFFTLLCNYIAPSLRQQKEYFRNVRPKPWKFPLNGMATPRSGLTWFNIIYVSIFQFCFTRPLLTAVAMLTEMGKKYDERSIKPEYAHLWIALLQGLCVLIAMYALLQFYSQVKDDVASHDPFLKFLSVKLVLFIVFWQAWFLSLLSKKSKNSHMEPPLRPNSLIAWLDLHVGLPCLLICFEMAVFAFLHLWAFPFRLYDLDHQPRGPVQPEYYVGGPMTAIFDALNPWDYAKAAARGFRWLFQGIHDRENDPSYGFVRKTRVHRTSERLSGSEREEIRLSKVVRHRANAFSWPSVGNIHQRNLRLADHKKSLSLG